MSRAATHPSWHRVAPLRPRLRGHARVHRHQYRSDVWYVVQNPVSRRVHRLNAAAYQFVGLLDGHRTVQSALDIATERLGESAPTQEEAIRLLAQLHTADLLQAESAPDLDELIQRTQQLRLRKSLQYVLSPLAMRFPLLDPQRFLDRTLALYRPLFTWLGFVMWLAVVAAGVAVAASHWGALTENLSDRVLSPQNLLLAALAYPVVKALHEFGHACATRAFGGEVHEMGVMLLVLFPVPYVDASSASAFIERRRRLVVGAAGMMVELFIAAIAMFLWVLVEPGIVRAALFNVMLIAGISTVVFNANPLLRFDGYYMLTDILDAPNLGQRATRYLGYIGQRWLLGMKVPPPPTAGGERLALAVFGTLSFTYRLAVVCGIALFVGTHYFFFGVLLAIWAVAASIFAPLVRGIVRLERGMRQQGRAGPALRAVGLVAGLVALACLVPFPQGTRTEGVVWIAERGQLRAGAEGFVSELLVASGERVRAGQPIAVLEDAPLRHHLVALRARLEELDARLLVELNRDRARAERVRDEIRAAGAELEREEERERALTVRALAEGTLVLAQAQSLEGRFLKQGELLGYVLDRELVSARTIVPQDSVDLVRTATRGVQIRTARNVAEVLPSALLWEVPAASARLPSQTLAPAGGGSVAPDPRDPKGAKMVQSQFEFELAFSAAIAGIGERLYVRFDHGTAPLARQWYRAARQLFLEHFNV